MVVNVGGTMQMLGGRRAAAHRQAAASSRAVGASLSNRRAATSSAAARSPVRNSSLLRHRLTNRRWTLTTTSRSDFCSSEQKTPQCGVFCDSEAEHYFDTSAPKYF
ncbi:hypothetical protein CWS02_24790 [Enterobacter sp. EA-1]|nr:hypothetical protein CWS02_24790 [Enterobacter sp. EA-1]